MDKLRNLLKVYYRKDLNTLYKFLIPKNATYIKVRSENLYKLAKGRKYDYVIADNCIADIPDIQEFFTKLRKYLKDDGRVVISHYNYLWEPILKTASLIGLRKKTKEQNWLENEDISNLLNLSGFDVITRQKRLLLPIYIPIVTEIFNKLIAHMPIINSLCLTIYVVARPKVTTLKEYSVTIVVPARNEAGNIPNIVRSIPSFGSSQEIIFVEGNSTDSTWQKIQLELNKKRKTNITIKAFKQTGKGKADAVKLGFRNSTGEILMIYDADMTVDAKDLKKFYDALYTNKGEFANGTRLVYPMEKDAMQTLNKFFNKFFSLIFTWILGQRFKDTLCGTKVLFKKDYLKIISQPKIFGKDPFGDFDLIFGSIKLNLKVTEIPVRYRERKYGSTNISRFKHGIQLARMIFIAYSRFMAW